MTNKIDKIQMPDGQVLELNGGSGLEICDIGTALYVDETKGLRRYLNGQIVDINTNTQAFLNRLLEIKNTNPDYFATEENWQAEALLNIDGCVYKFVLNYASDGETVVSVRLPKYPDYVEINAGGTLSVVGNGKTLGLTNGSADFGLATLGDSYVGNAYYSTTAFNKAVGSNATWDYRDLNANKNIGVTTDATKSGLEATLNQTKLKMRYFIQIATGSETEANIINDIELNNPFSLFDSKYSDHELHNLSWLKSEGQWNAKAVYPTAYDKLLKVYNGTETVEGLSVKLSTETYTDYDFVLNTAEETFRLPLLDGSENIVDYSTNIETYTTGATITTYTAPKNGFISYTCQGLGVGSELFIKINGKIINTQMVQSSNYVTNFNGELYVKKGDFIELKSAYIDSNNYIRFFNVVGNGSLYFYVGETVQNANLIDAGRIGEQLASLTTVVETYKNGTSWYRVWSDGWCEQGGIFDRGSDITSSSPFTITLLKSYNNTLYTPIVINGGNTSGSSYGWHIAVNNITKTATSFSGYAWKYETSNRFINWETKGYIS